VLREGEGDLEVLMLRRVARGFFGGLWVFPGGKVEDIDRSDLARAAVTIPEGADDLPWRAAALRETIEEVGVAITDPPLTEPVPGSGAAIFEHVLGQGAVLDGRRLRLVSRWVTPEAAPVRFDTRFYVARVAPGLALDPDPIEAAEACWVSPRLALERADDATWPMITPTLHHLRWLVGFDDPASVWDAAGRARVELVEPIIEQDGSEIRISLPDSAQLP
jgi:8-oxo-dGTP pyrophosphatase MutT (NUDIX family)